MSESGNNINILDETSLTEACKDIDTARKFLQDVDNLSKHKNEFREIYF